MEPQSNCLAGLRVLSLTRVIAGPVAGRTLASHGADVLWVTAPHLPALPACDGDTSRGKRTIQLNLHQAKDLATFHRLVQSADVFIDAYRPGALEAFEGVDTESLHAMNPSLIVAKLSAYGTKGPWANKRGFDSLVQTATGFNVSEARYFEGQDVPKALPVQALDHASGYLLAFGILAAVHDKLTCSTPTNSQVEVCLAWTAEWLRHLGQVQQGETTEEISPEDVHRMLEVVDMGTHQARFVKRSPEMTPSPRFDFYPQSLAHNDAEWLPRSHV
ncbi:hypothetical protein DYB32_005435 [Aphanomyces invadans]|nr:hypothetical protein DYB32_005435 [Aphanomyces invadans]